MPNSDYPHDTKSFLTSLWCFSWWKRSLVLCVYVLCSGQTANGCVLIQLVQCIIYRINSCKIHFTLILLSSHSALSVLFPSGFTITILPQITLSLPSNSALQILNAPISNLSPETRHSDSGFGGFPQSLQRISGILTQIRSRTIPSISVHLVIH